MDFDPANIAYMPTTGVRQVHHMPLVIANDESYRSMPMDS